MQKNILKRCYEAGQVDQFQYRLLEYNTTPVATMAQTPSDLFFGRLIKSKLPISDSLLVRNKLKESMVQEKIENKKEKQKYYYDKNARSLPPLNLGDLIIFKKSGREWHYGKIIGIFNERSYLIQDSFKHTFRRNRRFIAKAHNSDFHTSDMLFEENIRNRYSEELKEIQVIKPTNKPNNEIVPVHNDICEADESELTAGIHNDTSSDEYETAGSDVSEAENEIEIELPLANNEGPYRTRSGRIVKPPVRYGFD